MTVELARHLVRSGVLSSQEVEAAILQALTAGIAFAKALVDGSPATARLVERELGRLGVPTLHAVELARDLARELPDGMCSRLLAVPIGRAPDSGVVQVAAVDPLDAHVAEEFAFQLQSPVAVYRAPLSEVEAALEALPFTPSDPPPWSPADELSDERTLAFGSSYRWRSPSVPTGTDSAPGSASSAPADPSSGAAPRPADGASEPPIPLVRRASGASKAASRAARMPARRRTNPGIGVPPPASALTPVAELDSGAPTPARVDAEPSVLPPSGPVTDPLEQAVASLNAAQSPEQVVEALVDGAAGVGQQVMVFAVRGQSFDGRAARGVSGQPEIRAVHVPRGSGCAFDQAVQAGQYLGPVPVSPADEAIRRLLGSVDQLVYAAPVLVSTKPALVLLLVLAQAPPEVQQRLGVLLREAGSSLERIVLSRKM